MECTEWESMSVVVGDDSDSPTSVAEEVSDLF